MLCLVLAFACLVAATATLSAQTVPGGIATPAPGRPPLPLLIPLIFLIFLVVLGAVLRRERGRATTAPPLARSVHPR